MEIKKDESSFGMIDWYKKVMVENYANFEGRARRSEYWYFALTNVIITFALYILVIIGAAAESPIITIMGSILVLVYALATVIPSLAVAARRLHDTNKSGWMLLIGLIPIAGIILLVFYCTEGDKNANQYGPDPKVAYTDDINTIGQE